MIMSMLVPFSSSSPSTTGARGRDITSFTRMPGTAASRKACAVAASLTCAETVVAMAAASPSLAASIAIVRRTLADVTVTVTLSASTPALSANLAPIASVTDGGNASTVPAQMICVVTVNSAGGGGGGGGGEGEGGGRSGGGGGGGRSGGC